MEQTAAFGLIVGIGSDNRCVKAARTARSLVFCAHGSGEFGHSLCQ